jgi:hypothetical protein
VQTAGASHLKKVRYSRNICFLPYSASRQGQEIFFLFSTLSRQGLGATQYFILKVLEVSRYLDMNMPSSGSTSLVHVLLEDGTFMLKHIRVMSVLLYVYDIVHWVGCNK